MNIFLAMVLVVCVQQNLAEEKAEFRVENGTAAKLKQFPYQVAMKKGAMRRGWQYTFCGGTIIGPSKVLTAAHCFYDDQRSLWDVCCGLAQSLTTSLKKIYVVGGNLYNAGKYRSRNPDGKEQWRRPWKVIPHNQYKFPKNDIAVLFVRQPFLFTEYVNLIPYARSYKDYAGLKCVISGFGRMKNKRKSDILLWAQINVLSQKYCNMMERSNMKQFICTSTRMSDVGKGDSGGPLVCYNTGHSEEKQDGILVGVTCGKGKYISVFTRISSYKKLVGISRATTAESNFILCISAVSLINKLLSSLFC